MLTLPRKENYECMPVVKIINERTGDVLATITSVRTKKDDYVRFGCEEIMKVASVISSERRINREDIVFRFEGIDDEV